MGLQVTPSPAIFPADKLQRRLLVETVQLLHMRDALFQGTDQSHMIDVLKFVGKDRGASANQDHVAQLSQVEDCLGGLADQGPGGRMQAEQFIHHVRNLGDAIFGHKPGQAMGQIVILQDLLHQVGVDDRSRPRVTWSMRLQADGQLFRHDVRAGAGLAGNRHGTPWPVVRGQPLAGGLYVGVDVSPTALQSICQGHSLSLLPSLSSVLLLSRPDPWASPNPNLRRRAKAIQFTWHDLNLPNARHYQSQPARLLSGASPGHFDSGRPDTEAFPGLLPALFQDTLSEKPLTERRHAGAG